MPDSPAYRQILAVFAEAEGPLRARDLCEALDLGLESKHIEGVRSKLKRLVGRGILAEIRARLVRPAASVDLGGLLIVPGQQVRQQASRELGLAVLPPTMIGVWKVTFWASVACALRALITGFARVGHLVAVGGVGGGLRGGRPRQRRTAGSRGSACAA